MEWQNATYPTYCVLLFAISLYTLFLISWHPLSNGETSKSQLPRYKEYNINNKVKYAIISTSTPELHKTDQAWNIAGKYHFVFYGPLTALAWNRIGYKTVVLISGSKIEWVNDKCLNLVLKYLELVNATYIFLNPPEKNKVMVSQTSRIFGSSLVPGLKETDYLLTSDIDLWPFHSGPYELPKKKKLLVLNAFCCGIFNHNGSKVREVPMSNIGATVKTWKQIVTVNNRKMPHNAEDILNYFTKEFGSVAVNKVVKGGAGWSMDQRMVSVLIDQWSNNVSKKDLYIKERSIGKDRIDRSNWRVQTIKNKVDGHLLVNGYTKENWNKLQKLLLLMFNTKQNKYMDIAQNYTQDFQNCLNLNNDQKKGLS